MIKAIRIHKTGGPEVMSYEDFDLPAPGPGQVQVRHTAIGVNFLDIYHRSGLYPVPLPSGLGSEAAGTVAAVGPGVTGFAAGQRVGYSGGAIGSYAEANNLPADKLIKLPERVSDEDAAAALLKGMTAQYLLKRTFAVQPGQTILWHAAAGGVGLIACQWAKHLGATVIGTVGTQEKVQQAKDAGCDHVLVLGDGSWVGQVREITKGVGVPVVFDSIGQLTFDKSLDCLAIRGLMVSFGNASGAVPPMAPSVLAQKGSLYLTRPSLAHYTRGAKEVEETANDLFDVIAKGVVKIAINQRFALKDAAKAHEALAGRATTGATILIP